MDPAGIGPILDAGAVAALSAGRGDIRSSVTCRWYLDGRSGLEAYEAVHLPAAVFVDLDEHLTAEPGPDVGRHPLPTAEAFARSMGELGIGPDDTVVAYDDAGGMSAGRLVWMLRVLGQHAALLDGGIAVPGMGPWKPGRRCGHPLTFRSAPGRTGRSWTSARSLPERSGRVLLDARAPERYRGEVELVDPRAGHVPGAVNAPFAANLVDGRFRPVGRTRRAVPGARRGGRSRRGRLLRFRA